MLDEALACVRFGKGTPHMSYALVFALVCGAAAVVYGIYTTKQVMAADAGN